MPLHEMTSILHSTFCILCFLHFLSQFTFSWLFTIIWILLLTLYVESHYSFTYLFTYYFLFFFFQWDFEGIRCGEARGGGSTAETIQRHLLQSWLSDTKSYEQGILSTCLSTLFYFYSSVPYYLYLPWISCISSISYLMILQSYVCINSDVFSFLSLLFVCNAT